MNNYIDELSKDLKALNEQDRQDIIEFYTEYLEDGGFKTYDACLQELGSPRKVALKAMADRSTRASDETGPVNNNYRGNSKTDAKVIWIVLLAILSSPVTIPLALCIILFLVFIPAVVVLSILCALAISIFFIFASAINLISISFISGLTMLGIGFVFIGILLLFIALIQLIIHWIRIFVSWIYRKSTSKGKTEGGND
ncbi:membrane protein [Philodulcilactobacillus myokoensis]|uniref:Membrane protein n=1 Tax=Philodulcilactobacillus myokoensis TaxID=2929573 RepID=A0A9W6B0K7_9LACO|nr:DUF1700 domain-containing protein [Philodulcilactobacillus myokoensis]GLB46335.1 membrane protein [Philodulcilactobacillus myokoensis]